MPPIVKCTMARPDRSSHNAGWCFHTGGSRTWIKAYANRIQIEPSFAATARPMDYATHERGDLRAA